MATERWVGNAAAVAQVDTATIGGTVEVGDVFIGTINSKALSYSATSTTPATDATGFAAAWTALDSSYYPEFFEETAAATSGGALTVTANTPGKPFTLAVSTTEAGGGAADLQTFSSSTTTVNAGPNVWGTAANWSGGAKPGAGDTFYIDNSAIDILYDLSQAGATVTSGNIAQSFTGKIGLPKFNDDGFEYPEYRTDYLTLDCSAWNIGYGPGNGSGRIKINSGTVQTAVVVNNTGFPLENGIEAMLWKGTNASNTVTVTGRSSVGIAIFGGETATIATLTVEGNANVRCGAGATLSTVVVNGGTLEVNSAIGTSLTVKGGGKVTINGTGAVAQLNVWDGSVVYNTTGALGGNTVIGQNGFIDFSQDPRAKTVTNPIDAYNTDPVNDPDQLVSGLIIDYNGIAPLSGLGTNVRLTRGTPA